MKKKKNEVMPFAETWMDLDSIRLSEAKLHLEKEISHGITYMWTLNNDTKECIYKTDSQT